MSTRSVPRPEPQLVAAVALVLVVCVVRVLAGAMQGEAADPSMPLASALALAALFWLGSALTSWY